MVRSIMATQLLPQVLFGEILKTSVYLKNRSPGPDPETLFEHFNHKKPNLNHLRIVGAKTWVYILNEKRKGKLIERVWKGIFVGYDGTNQFRVYNPRTRRIHVSRDVIVDESASGVTTLPSDFDPNSLWSNQDDTFIR